MIIFNFTEMLSKVSSLRRRKQFRPEIENVLSGAHQTELWDYTLSTALSPLQYPTLQTTSSLLQYFKPVTE